MANVRLLLPSRFEARARPAIRVAIVVALSVIALGTSLPNLIPYFWPIYGGFFLYADATNHVAYVHDDAAEAGIKIGDTIDYKSMPLNDRYEGETERHPLVGTITTFYVIHNGVERPVRLTARHLAWQWDRTHLAIVAAKKLCALVFILLAMALVLIRPTRLTWVLFLLAIGSTFSNPYFFSFLPAGYHIALEAITDILQSLGAAAFFALAMLLPDDDPQGWRRLGVRFAPYAFVAVAALIAWTNARFGFFGSPVPIEDATIQISWAAFYCLGVVALVGTLFEARRSRRPAMAWIALTLSLGGLTQLEPVASNLVPNWPLGPNWFEGSFLFTVVASLLLAYLIIRARIVVVHHVVMRSLAYAALSVGLVAVFATINLLFERTLAQTTVVIPLEIIAAVALGFWLSGLYDVTSALARAEIDAPRAAAQGRRITERDILMRALARAERARSRGLIASVRARCAFSAWFAGDDEEFSHHLAELERYSSRQGHRALRYFLWITRGMRGDDLDPPESAGSDLAAMAHIIACGTTDDVSIASGHARQAVTAANRSDIPMLEVVARLALGEFAPDERAKLFEQAFAICQAAGLLRLRHAVQAVRDGEHDLGMLQLFVEQRLRKLRVAKPVLEIRFLDGHVRSFGNDVQLRDKGLGLLLTVAQSRGLAGTDEIADRLWPGLDSRAARNALKACVYRLRRSLGDELAVVRMDDAYRVREGALVDLWEIDDNISKLRRSVTVDESQRQWLRTIYPRVRKGRPAYLTSQTWFEEAERHIVALTHEVGERLGKDALTRGDAAEALSVGRAMVTDDPCDEPAREIVVRALLLNGDASAALFEYRSYREALERELQAEPSSVFEELFRTREQSQLI